MPAKARNCKGIGMLAAILLMAAAPAEPPPTYGSWMLCVVRTAEDLAKRTTEPIDVVVQAALGNCQAKRNAYHRDMERTLPSLLSHPDGRRQVERMKDDERQDLVELATMAALDARYPKR